jgi:hypothetical protein
MTEDHAQTNDTPADGTAVLTASIAPGYWIRAVLIALMCLVLGLWGIYDYVVAIPNAERMSQRREVTQDVKTALESTGDAQANAAARTAALRKIDGALAGFGPEQVRPQGDAGQPDSDVAWWDMLQIWKNSLQGMTGYDQTPTPEMQQAGMIVVEAMELYGEAQPPSAYDRPVQWMFIASLVFVPFYFWGVVKYGPRTYTLDAQGAVHTPEGVFERDRIEDIDMSRWMAKSTAELVLTDGERVKLDAYIFKNLHLIIGAIAHRLHPEAWAEDAKQVKAEEKPDSPAADDA